jgi:site-specific DNA recombinase
MRLDVLADAVEGGDPDRGGVPGRGPRGRFVATGRGPKYRFSGLMKCACCGANYVICGSYAYGCAANVNGGDAACSNRLLSDTPARS